MIWRIFLCTCWLFLYLLLCVCFVVVVAVELKFELCIYSGYKPLLRYKICKYFLPFHFVDGFLCHAKVYLHAFCFFFWCQIQKIIVKLLCQGAYYLYFFYDFYGLRYYINPFWINFCVVKDSGWLSFFLSSFFFFFCMWLFSFSNAICWNRDCPFQIMEEEMATHSSVLAWIIPWTEELSRLQSLGLQRVGHDWVTELNTFPNYVLGSFVIS